MTVKIPGYKILGTLGKGGMATVYLAEHEIFQRKVALKVMAGSLADDPSFGERFIREARIVSQLVHPNIVTVYDVGVHEGHYYLSMEFIDGKDLKHARKHLSLERKVQVVLDIAKALEYAGNKGYVHRDIKPENIMLYSEDCRAVLTDFGIARAAESEISFTQTGTAIGTPHYMSPEQAKGQSVDIRSDIYGLGVVFYLLLAGCVPFDAESAVAIGIKHITDPIPELPEGLEALQPILDKMLAKLPKDRYQRPAELVADLSRVDLSALVAASNKASARAAEAFESAGDDAPTVIARASVRGGADSQTLLYSGDSADADDPTPVLGLEAVTLEEQGAPVMPWLAGLVVLLLVVAAVLYSQNPGGIRSWLEASDGSPVLDASAPGLAATPSPGAGDAAVSPDGDSQAPANPDAVSQEPEASKGAAEAQAAQKQPPGDRSADLRQRIETLRAGVGSDPSLLRPLLKAVRQLKEVAPDTNLRELEADIVSAEVERIQQLIEDDQPTAAKSRIKELRQLPLEGLSETVAGLEDAVAQQEQIAQWLREAENFLAADTLTRPAENNARARFAAVLAVDPNNGRAQEGLAQVVARLTELAAEALEANRLTAAKDYIASALEVNPNSTEAAALKKQLDQQEVQLQQAQLQTLLAQGDAQLREGQYFTPENESAFYYFSRALALQPNSDAARRGISRTIDAFKERLLNLVAQDHVAAVRELMQTAHRLLPNDERLASVELRVEQAIADKMLAQQPRVSSIVVVGGAVSEFVQEQPESIRAERTISVSFRYHNFDAATSVIQAILLDGSRSMQIAQVPVVLTGGEGTKAFRIDRPVDGFPSGRYTVDLMYQNTRLATQSFRVE